MNKEQDKTAPQTEKAAQQTESAAPVMPAKKKGVGFKDNPTLYIAYMATLSALAFIVLVAVRIPIPFTGFLKFEAKSVIITIGGYMFGPLAAVIISVVTSFIEMVTISEDMWYGLIMNIVALLAFSGTASLIYKFKRDFKGAIIGLACGIVAVTVAMTFWNWWVVPLYLHETSLPFMEVSAIRELVVDTMLMQVFLPFNLIKWTLNSALIMLIYKPLVVTLRKTNLLPGSGIKDTYSLKNSKQNLFTVIGAALIIIVCILLFALVKSWG